MGFYSQTDPSSDSGFVLPCFVIWSKLIFLSTFILTTFTFKVIAKIKLIYTCKVFGSVNIIYLPLPECRPSSYMLILRIGKK